MSKDRLHTMTSDEFFARAEHDLKTQRPFSIYRKSTSTTENRFSVNGFFQNDSNLYTTADFTKSGFVMAPFNLTERKAVIIPRDKAELIHTTVRSEEAPSADPKGDIAEKKAVKENHLNLISQALETIKEGGVEKVVLSREITLKVKQPVLQIFKRLMQAYPNAFVYCWFHPKIGLWLGATPESLLSVSGQTLKTVSLAGTKLAWESAEPQWTIKEIEEQRYVTDFIKQTLQGEVVDLTVGQIENIRAGNLWHLKTEIAGRLDHREQLGSIIKALHPTPAVCGLPKEKAKQFILKKENYDRAFYAGFLGELNLTEERPSGDRDTPSPPSTDLFVNLRCMQKIDKYCRIYVGGGIVKDSDPEKEWQETVNKSRTIHDVI